jgi:membrane protease subunit (stomatin/prohibitin family)
MKLLLVTSLKEYQKTVAEIFNKSGIAVFSVTKTIGFKDQRQHNLLDDWFTSGTDQFDSVFVFSFTEEEKSEKALNLIREYNSKNDTGFPIRAFVIPVDKSSYTSIQ